MADLPSGVVTLAFTDIEGSTRLWDAFPDDMRRALSIHHTTVRESVVAHRGAVVKDTGDGMFLAFGSAADAVAFAVDVQRRLAETDWPVVIGSLGVRIALHTAEMTTDGQDYRGHEVNLTARVEAAGHGGQILVTDSVLARTTDLPDGASTLDLGDHSLRGISDPVRIHQLAAPGLRSDFPRLKTAVRIDTHLPMFTTSFLGRSDDIASIARLVDEGHRLITLLGPGGMGKTRLAVEVARRIDERGTTSHFLSLVGVSDPEQVVKALGDSIGFVFDIHISGQIPEKMQLFDRLRLQPLVLVLDNLEHLDVGSLVGEMLERIPTLTIIATSRRALEISAEWRFDVHGLDRSELLFAERARQNGVEIDVDGLDGSTVRSVCERLGAMPLAVELAAAWAGVMTVADIAREVEKGLEILESTARDVPERHRSVSAVFDHSWALLPDDLRVVFGRLAVLTAPFDRDAAAAVAGASTRDLLRLMSHSLVHRDGPDRFSLHPLLRELAMERSQPSDIDDARHAAARHHADRLLAGFEQLRGGPDQLAARDAIAADIEHLRTVQRLWVEEWPDDALLELVVALNEFYFQHSWVDQKQALEALLAHMEVEDRTQDREAYLYASAWLALADSSFTTPDHIRMRLDATEAATRARGGRAWRVWLIARGIEAGLRSEFADSLPWYEQAWAVEGESTPLERVVLSAWHGWSRLSVGDAEGAADTFGEGLRQAEADQHELGRAFLLSKYGIASDALGDHDAAIEFHHEGREIFAKREDRGGQGYTLSRLSESYRLKGDFQQAIRYALEGLAHFEAMNHRWGIAVSHGRAGLAELGLGAIADAVEHFVACLDEAEGAGLADQVHYGIIGIARAGWDAGERDISPRLLVFESTATKNPYADHARVPDLDETEVDPGLDESEVNRLARRLAGSLLS